MATYVITHGRRTFLSEAYAQPRPRLRHIQMNLQGALGDTNSDARFKAIKEAGRYRLPTPPANRAQALYAGIQILQAAAASSWGVQT